MPISRLAALGSFRVQTYSLPIRSLPDILAVCQEASLTTWQIAGLLLGYAQRAKHRCHEFRGPDHVAGGAQA